MTTSVKEQFGTDWQQAQEVSAQRLSRIREIVKAAASEAFSEFKTGSTEVRGLSRKALASLVVSLREQDVPANGSATLQDRVAGADEKELPTWRQLLTELFGLVRERRVEWLQLFREQAKRYPTKVDQDLSAKYGDRYQQVKDQFKKAQARYQTTANRAKAKAPAQRVEVEVLED
ncbi:MAG TPA: hypothetical protein V6D29_19375 [Leptolyngbyaceae cyanobacterium]